MAQKVRIIGVPMDLGQSRRGVDMGPSALRGAGLQSSIKKLGLQVEDIGNLSVKQPEEMPVGEKRAKYLQEIAETCGDVAAAAEKSLNEGFLPLVLGGDHSIAAGVAAGVSSHFRKDKKEIGYLWLDAHGDMNTPESSPSGNVHGMPLAAIMGYGADELVNLGGFKPKAEPGNIVIVGARDLDAQERKIVKKSGIHVFRSKEIGYLWLDAHGDMNTPESSPSGNVHGMPLAAIMGYGADELVNLGGFKPKAEPGNIVIVGARDLDAQERKIVKKSGIHVF